MSRPNTLSKKDVRRLRNLQAANDSRQRRREQISALTEEKARLTEANALLRARLNISPDAVLPPVSSVDGTSRQTDLAELGPAMQALLLRDNIEPDSAVDVLDRLVSGGNGKGAAKDPGAARRISEAARKAPKDVPRPLKHVMPSGGASSSTAGNSARTSSAVSPWESTRSVGRRTSSSSMRLSRTTGTGRGNSRSSASSRNLSGLGSERTTLRGSGRRTQRSNSKKH